MTREQIIEALKQGHADFIAAAPSPNAPSIFDRMADRILVLSEWQEIEHRGKIS